MQDVEDAVGEDERPRERAARAGERAGAQIFASKAGADTTLPVPMYSKTLTTRVAPLVVRGDFGRGIALGLRHEPMR
jgi:hypothetical protein